MVFTFLTVVTTVGILAAVAIKYLELKAKQPLQHDHIIAIQQEINRLKQRLQTVETILVDEENDEKPLIDLPETESSVTEAAQKPRTRKKSAP